MTTKNKLAELPEVSSLVLTDAEARKRAKEIYINMDVCRIDRIARRVKRRLEVVCQWRDEDGWLEDRAKAREARRQEMMKGVERKQERAKKTLTATAKMRDLMIAEIDKGRQSLTVDDMCKLTASLDKLQAISDRAYTDLQTP